MKAGWVAVQVRAAAKEDGKPFVKLGEMISRWCRQLTFGTRC